MSIDGLHAFHCHLCYVPSFTEYGEYVFDAFGVKYLEKNSVLADLLHHAFNIISAACGPSELAVLRNGYSISRSSRQAISVSFLLRVYLL